MSPGEVRTSPGTVRDWAVPTTHIQAACPPDAVFAVLANGWLYPSWVVGASRIRRVEAGWPAVGTSIHHSFGVWPLVIDDTTSMLEWDPPHGCVLKARGWPMGSAKVVLEVEATEDGCRISLSEDAVEGPGSWVPKPLRYGPIHIRNVETVRRLRFLAEGRTDPEQQA